VSNYQKNKLVKKNYFSAGIVIILFMITYWLFDVVIDVFVFEEDTFFVSLFSPDPMCLTMRLINLPLLLGCVVVAQWMYFKRKAAENEIEILRGILPVCMYCKDIRDDEGTEQGQGKWLRMEEYINTKNGTDISHGCCPECYEKHKDD
jgi:hypothetical protein